MTLNCDLIRSNSAGLNSLAPQFKGVPEDRHDRPILGTNHMVHADGVPEHDIGLVDRSICLGPGGKALSRGTEGRVITGGVTFVVAVWRDPQIMVNEAGTLPGIVVRREQSWRGHAWHQLVTGGIADMILLVRAGDSPQSRMLHVCMEHRVALGPEHHGFANPDAAAGIVRRKRFGYQVIGEKAIRRSVDIKVDSETEVMVVIDGDQVSIYKTAIRIGRLRRRATARGGRAVIRLRNRARFDFCNTGRADRDAYRTVLLKGPVEDVIVIAYDRVASHDEIAFLPAFGIFGQMAPGHIAGFSFEHAKRVGHRSRTSLVRRHQSIHVDGVLRTIRSAQQRLCKPSRIVFTRIEEIAPPPVK